MPEETEFSEILAFLPVAIESPRVLFHNQEGKSAIVRFKGTLYLFWDNGGEIGIEKINSGVIPRFVPLSWFGEPLDAVTLVCRIANVLDNEDIDFSWRAEKDDVILLDPRRKGCYSSVP